MSHTATAVAIYLGLIVTTSVVTFTAYGLDKRRAVAGGRRIPERSLHVLGLVGGWPGGLLGQRTFRHKTKKVSFLIVFWLVAVLHVGLVAAAAYLLFSLQQSAYPDPRSKGFRGEDDSLLPTADRTAGTLTAEPKSLAGAVLDRQVYAAQPGTDAPSASAPERDADGFLVHRVRSAYQTGETQVRVLAPDVLEPGKRYPAVYVLPVEAGREERYGDGLKEVRKLGLHNRYKAVFVAPTFSQLPWYADHPTKKEVRQESHLLKVVMPLVEDAYPVRTDAAGRLLLGFSKSGFGAWSLLLRHPDVFGRAAAWDAPLMLDRPGKYGSGDVFGTDENFAGYRVTDLLAKEAGRLRADERLVLLGYGNFRGEHQAAHALMEKLKVAHAYRDGPARKHDWHSGWVAEAAESLLAAPVARPPR